MHTSLYMVADRDLGDFVTAWLDELEATQAAGPTMLDEARDGDEAATFGGAFIMMNIAPRVWGDKGTDDELLLFAVIYSYALSRPADPWDGCAAYVRRAFAYVRHVGEAEAARTLRAEVAAKAAVVPDEAEKRMLAHMGIAGDPARLAARQQRLAPGSQRDLRAAAALAPDTEFDLFASGELP